MLARRIRTLALIVAVPAAAAGAMWWVGAPAVYEDAVSREFTIQTGDRDSARDAVAREFTIQAGDRDGARDALSREFTLQVRTPDLSIEVLAAPSEGFVEEEYLLVWRVTNVGERATQGASWLDRVSFSGVMNGSADFAAPFDLAPGESYDRSGTFEFPATSGQLEITIETDGSQVVIEDPSEENNSTGALAVDVLPALRPDLTPAITALAAPPGPNGYPSGMAVAVTFEITNGGAAATDAVEWQDAFYLVEDDGDGLPPANLAGAQRVHSALNLNYLLPGQLYGQTVDVQLPTNQDAGDYFLALRTDDLGDVLEADEDNNLVFSALIQVELQPQPDLVATVLDPLPGGIWQSGCSLQLDWTLDNAGEGTAIAGAFRERVWLADNGDPDSSGLIGAALATTPSTPIELDPGDAPWARSALVTLPVDSADGTYWLKVETDIGDDVPELTGGEFNNWSASPAITTALTPTPDLVAAWARPAAPGSAVLAGHPVEVEWRVTNPAGPGWDVRLTWRDRIYLVPDGETLDPGMHPLLGSFSESTVLMPGSLCDSGQLWTVPPDYQKSRTVVLPTTTAAGDYAFVVVADAPTPGVVFEFSSMTDAELNNTSAPAMGDVFTVDVIPADLALVAAAQAGARGTGPPTAGAPGELVELPWTVTNVAVDPEAATNVSSWRDRVYLSEDPLALVNEQVFATRLRSMALEPGESYAVVATAAVPLVAAGDYWLHFVADYEQKVFESDTTNNSDPGHPFTVTAAAANLVCQNVAATETMRPGDPLPVSWSVENQGTAAPLSNSWTDRVYVSQDVLPDPDSANNVLIGAVGHVGGLDPGDAPYVVAQDFMLPASLAEGVYWVFVVADATHQVFETNEDDNLDATRALVFLDGPPLCDLAVQNVDAQDTTAGQALSIDYEVTNVGAGATSSAAWSESFYLSHDQAVDATDVYLGFFLHDTHLAPGEVRPVSVAFDVPLAVSGEFVLLVETNSNAAAFEDGALANNVNYDPSLVTITPADPVELSITSIELFDSAGAGPLSSVVLGQPVQIRWDTLNSSPTTAAVGSWVDAFFLSDDAVWSADDVLIGRERRAGRTIAPMATSTEQTLGSETPFVIPAVVGAPGDLYYVIGVSDVFDQMPEGDEDDNAAPSAAPVTARPIVIEYDGGPLAVELPDGESRWLVLRAPGDAPVPADRTIDVELEHPNHSRSWVELYAREGGLPRLGEYDVGGLVPGDAFQTLRLPRTGGGDIYLLARAVMGVGGAMLDARVEAFRRPFALEGVSPARPGAGVVTLVLEGAELWRTSRVELRTAAVLPGAASVASALHYDEATGDLLALFDLTGVATGAYDLVAIDEAAVEESPLVAGVTVDPPLALAASVALQSSPSLRRGEVGELRLTFSNSGNVNVPYGLFALGLLQPTADAPDDERVVLSANQLGSLELERSGARESLVAILEDLGPSQTHALRFDAAVGVDWPVLGVSPALSGAPWSTAAYAPGFVDPLVEELRLAVLADPSSNSGLLEFAAASAGQSWRDAVAIQLEVDQGPLHRPGDQVRTGRELVQAIADAAFAGSMPPLGVGDEVPSSAVDTVVAEAYCRPFAGSAYDCDELFRAECGDALAYDVVALPETTAPTTAAVCIETRDPDDPNEKDKPAGIPPDAYVAPTQTLEYRIHFENDAGAGAWASRVQITDPLLGVLNAASARFGAIQIGNTLVEVPENALALNEELTLEVTEEVTTLVRINAGVDATTNQARWVFQAIDPETGLPPIGTDNGILPPAGEGPEGSAGGWVTFSITALPNTTSGLSADNRAMIQMNNAPTIETNAVSNRMDADAPTSVMTQALMGDPFEVSLSWSADDTAPNGDPGAGVGQYRISYAVGAPDAPRSIWLQTSATSAVFFGAPATEYHFFCEASDRVGNLEAKAVPDLSVTTAADCNANGVPDDEDISGGSSTDVNGNGVPDECECTWSSYCVATVNSTGQSAAIAGEGVPSLSAGSFTLSATDLPSVESAMFLHGTAPIQVPFGDGFRCVGGTVTRLRPVMITGAAGTAALELDLQDPQVPLVAGETAWFQLWYRDAAAAGAGFNLTDGLEVRFCE